MLAALVAPTLTAADGSARGLTALPRDAAWSIGHDPARPFRTGQQPMQFATVKNCVDQGNDTDTASTTTAVVVRRCGVYVTEPSVFLLIASGTVGMAGASATDEFEAEFHLAEAQVGDLPGTLRIVDTKAGVGQHKTFAVTTVRTGGAGFYDFQLRVRRNSGPGIVRLTDHVLHVIAAPAAAAQTSICGAGQSTAVILDDDSDHNLLECTLAVPAASQGFIIGTASLDMTSNQASAQYEARFGLRQNGNLVSSAESFVNVYAGSNDDVDENIVSLGHASVPAGERTFRLVGRRESGTGSVRIEAPQLAVLVVPDTAGPVCRQIASFDPQGSAVDVGAACEMAVAQPSSALVLASCSANLDNVAVSDVAEIKFGLALEGGFFFDYADRLVRLQGDALDGSDRSMFINAALPLDAGGLVLAFTGQRVLGTVPWRCFGASLSVVLLPPAISTVFADGFE